MTTRRVLKLHDQQPDIVLPIPSRWIHCGSIAIWPGRRLVRVGRREVELTASEMAVLLALVRAHGEPVTRKSLTQACGRSGGHIKVGRSVDTFVFSIRRKLGDDAKHPRIIITVPSVGYAIETDDGVLGAQTLEQIQ